MTDGTVAEERHRAMRDAPMRLDLGPPHAAVPQANPVLVERFGDNHVLDAFGRKIAALGHPRHATIATGLFVRRCRNLDRAREVRHDIGERLGRDNRRREAALHVARAAAENLVVLHLAAERIDRPPAADFDDIMVRVEMHSLARCPAFAPSDDVPARMGVAVACRPLCPQQFRRVPMRRQPPVHVVTNVPVMVARRVHRREADQVLRELDEVVAARVNLGAQAIVECRGHGVIVRRVPCRVNRQRRIACNSKSGA
jgi:hypothetical protein